VTGVDDRVEVWVTWTGATRSHLGVGGVRPGDVRVGGFPLECGRWAPEAFDVDEMWESPSRRCSHCLRAKAATE
jgi:hypothetical protein